VFYLSTNLLIVGVEGIVGGEVEAAALFAFEGPAGDEIADINHVAQLADVAAGLDTLEEALGLFVEHVETVPGTVQAQVAAYDAYVVGHDLVDLADGLGDEYFLLVGHRTLVVPFGDAVVPVVEVDVLQGVLGSGVGIDDGLDE